LKGQTTYNIRVSASNRNGESAKSETIQARTEVSQDSLRPPSPINLVDTQSMRTTNSMMLNWEQPGNGGSPITGYRIKVTGQNGQSNDIMVDSSKTSHQLNNLYVGEYYSI